MQKSEERASMESMAPKIALTIAGFDPSGGAGITADLKTFAAHRLYGVSCATALTVQSTRGVRQLIPLDATLVTATLACLAEDLPPDGIKIGMLATDAVADAVADFLSATPLPLRAIVLDPVLRSTSGALLLDEAGRAVLRDRLLARVGWITPNIAELAILLGEPVATAEDIPAQATRLQHLAARSGNPTLRVIVTGGHLDPPNDYLLGADGSGEWIEGKRVETNATHGTGCAFSSSLVSQVIAGTSDRQAVISAKAYVTAALREAYPIGHGKGPLNHLFGF